MISKRIAQIFVTTILIVSVVCLFLAVISHQTLGFYQNLRFLISFVGIILITLVTYKFNSVIGIASAIMVIVFNPVAQFHFNKDTWHILDITFGVFLIANIMLINGNIKELYNFDHKTSNFFVLIKGFIKVFPYIPFTVIWYACMLFANFAFKHLIDSFKIQPSSIVDCFQFLFVAIGGILFLFVVMLPFVFIWGQIEKRFSMELGCFDAWLKGLPDPRERYSREIASTLLE